MSLVSLRQILDHAAENSYGVPAFNINNMEQLLAVMKAADATNSPVILQASSGARGYASDEIFVGMVKGALLRYPHLPVCLHQDHGASFEICQSAIANGFSSVMMDGSLEADHKTPSSFEYNVNITKKVVEAAHAAGASVEGELGVIGSLETGEGEKEDGHGFEGKLDKKMLLTDPDQAVEFVKRTGVDALAVAVGTSHGAYKFTRKPTGDILSIETIKRVHEKLPNAHIVMHGSSSVTQDLQDKFNQNGGEMPQTYGVPVEEIQRAIKHGVRKINVDTDGRIAMVAAIRGVLKDDKGQIDLRKFLKPAIDAMAEVCKARLEAFGAAGNGSKIKQVPLSVMIGYYNKK